MPLAVPPAKAWGYSRAMFVEAVAEAIDPDDLPGQGPDRIETGLRDGQVTASTISGPNRSGGDAARQVPRPPVNTCGRGRWRSPAAGDTPAP